MKWDNNDLKVGLLVFGVIAIVAVSFLWINKLWARDVAPFRYNFRPFRHA